MQISIVSGVSLFISTAAAAYFDANAFPPIKNWYDSRTKAALEAAFPDALNLALQAGDNYQKYKYIWDKYFPASDHDIVQGVWNRITNSTNLGWCVISGPENSTLNRCNNTIDAFTIPFLRGPPQVTSTYFCELAFKAPQQASNISCQDLGTTVSSKMTFLGATILREWLHNEGIGKNVTNSNGLNTDDLCALRQSQPQNCISHAEAYVALALHVLWTKTCGHEFTNPKCESAVSYESARDHASSTNIQGPKLTFTSEFPSLTISSESTHELPTLIPTSFPTLTNSSNSTAHTLSSARFPTGTVIALPKSLTLTTTSRPTSTKFLTFTTTSKTTLLTTSSNSPKTTGSKQVPEPSCVGRSQAQANSSASAIDEFCSQWANITIIPRILWNEFNLKIAQALAISETKQIGRNTTYANTTYVLEMNLARNNCTKATTNRDDCVNNFGSILNGCDVVGGSLQHSCLVYNMTQYMKVDTNTTHSAYSDPGSFECSNL